MLLDILKKFEKGLIQQLFALPFLLFYPFAFP